MWGHMPIYRDKMPLNVFSEMLGLTMSSVCETEDDELVFVAENGKRFRFYHSQDCCERVCIEDICGSLNDLVGSAILQAEEVSAIEPYTPTNYDYSYTWTFYKFATLKGSVTVRWLGTSTGYYSESVSYSVE